MSDVLADIPFIYDARRKVATLRGTVRTTGERLVLELVERRDDDSHTARLAGGAEFHLREDDVSFTDSTIHVRTPDGDVEFYVDPVYVRKFKAFTRGNVPTPDVAGETLP